MSLAARYLDAADHALHRLMTTEADNLRAASALLARSWGSGGALLVARTNHTLHEELVDRAGGPVAIAVLDDGGVAYDECVVSLPNARKGDVVVVHTNCGTTAKAVSIAMVARASGVGTIGLTQLAFETSEKVSSEHPSGARLHEVCDVVIDLGGPFGDGVLELPGAHLRAAPISGALGVAAAWAVIAGAWDLLTEEGLVPLVLQSVQVQGAASHNAKALACWEANRLGVVRMEATLPSPMGEGTDGASGSPPP